MKKYRASQAYALLCFATLSTIFTLTTLSPKLSHSQSIYLPSHTYSLTDYSQLRMVFEPQDQRVVEQLTKSLLDRERSAGHWEGNRQEDVIRETDHRSP